MLVEMKLTGKVRDVTQAQADFIVKSKLGSVYQARQVKAEPAGEEISPRTGKPKRQYRRRDMKAED